MIGKENFQSTTWHSQTWIIHVWEAQVNSHGASWFQLHVLVQSPGIMQETNFNCPVMQLQSTFQHTIFHTTELSWRGHNLCTKSDKARIPWVGEVHLCIKSENPRVRMQSLSEDLGKKILHFLHWYIRQQYGNTSPSYWLLTVYSRNSESYLSAVLRSPR